MDMMRMTTDILRVQTNAMCEAGAAVREATAQIIQMREAHERMLEALKIALVQLGEYHDGDGTAKLHAINIVKRAIAEAE